MEGEAAREGGERWEGRGRRGPREEANCMCRERKRILKRGREEQTERKRRQKERTERLGHKKRPENEKRVCRGEVRFVRVAGCVYVCDRTHACFGARSAQTGRTQKEADQTITAGESHAFLCHRQLRLDVWDHVSRLRGQPGLGTKPQNRGRAGNGGRGG